MSTVKLTFNETSASLNLSAETLSIVPVETTVTLNSFDGAFSTAIITAQVAAHSALTTGVHGVGASTVASAADVSSAVSTHAALETAHSLTADFIDAMQAASSPTTANPFITDSAADSLIATHAALQTGVHGLSITAGKTLTVQNNITLAAGADGYTLTIPATGTAALLGIANTFTLGPQTIQTGADANKGLIVKANSATQSANLQDWQSSTGGVLLSISSEAQISQTITKTSVVVGDYAGMTFAIRGQPGAVAGSEVLIGITGQAKVNSTFAFNQAIGMRASALNESSGNITIAQAFNGIWNPQSGGASSAYGFRSQMLYSAGYTATSTLFANFVADTVTKFGTPSGVTTTVYGYLVNDIVTNSGATNAYGLYISAIAGAATINSAIKTLGGTVQFTHNADSQLLTVTGHTTLSTATALAGITRNDTAAGIAAMLGLTALGSGANGDGGSILLSGKSSTTAAQSMGAIKWLWNDATHASRKADVLMTAYDTAEREILRGRGSGAAPMLSFYGGTPVVRGTALTAADAGVVNSGDATTDGVINNIRTRLGELEARLNAATGCNLIA